jgi:REP element-mobilizing transposase RayT
MMPSPLYGAENIEPAYQLRYGWIAWPAPGSAFPQEFDEAVTQAAALWEGDGLRVLERRCCAEMAQLVLSTTPQVSPVFLAARAKGRVDYALRTADRPVQFSRKLAVRSIGDNHREDVERYIERQVPNARFRDPEFVKRLERYTVANHAVDLSLPTETRSGRYWYNLHVVLVTQERYQRADDEWLGRIFERCLAIAKKKGHAISRISVMPDHIHIAARGNIEHSPEQIAMSFQNNLAYALGQIRVWQPTYYAGTFSEYDMGAVRHNNGERPF